MPPVSEWAKENARKKAREYQAERRNTPEFAEWYANYLVESRERRRAYKEQQRRKAGALPAAQRPKKTAIHDSHVKLWKQYCYACYQGHKHRDDPKFWQSQRYDSHVIEWKKNCRSAWWKHKYRTNSEFNARQKLRASLKKKARLDGQLMSQMAVQLKRGRFIRGWRELLGYTAGELVAHLKRTIPNGRTWDDFLCSALHIDHIVPCAAFDLTRLEEVRACWSLGNLRLLDAAANRRKSARVETLL